MKRIITNMSGEKVRYLIVGGSCAISYVALVYLFVNFFKFWYLPSSIFSFIFITILGFFAQKFFTFRNNSKEHKKQITLFLIMASTSLIVNTLSMYFFVSILGIWYIIASTIAPFIALAWNYLGSKYVVFRLE